MGDTRLLHLLDVLLAEALLLLLAVEFRRAFPSDFYDADARNISPGYQVIWMLFVPVHFILIL